MLFRSRHELIAVITQPPAPVGRGRQMQESAVSAWAAEHELPVFVFENINDADARNVLTELDFDAVAVVAFGQILSADTLALAHHGWINLHFSLLPAWRGAAPVQRCIMAGESITGATTFILANIKLGLWIL